MRRLILHIPDLEHFPGGARALPRRLRDLLGRAARVEASGDALTTALSDLLGDVELPGPAPASRLANAALEWPEAGSWWLRFDPVVVLPDLTAVWVERPLALDFGDASMRAPATALAEMFAAEGLTWTPAPGQRHGLLQLPARPEVRFRPLAACPGRRLDELLPEGRDAARWCRLINESQMLFHQYRALDRGDQRGVGLWFWGDGRVPPAPARPLVQVVCDSPPVRLAGLMRWQNSEPLAVDAGRSLLDSDGPALLLHWPLAGRDPLAALEAFCADWPGGPARRPVAVVGSHGYWRWARRPRWWSRRGDVAGLVETSS